jgi:hypothetical protein
MPADSSAPGEPASVIGERGDEIDAFARMFTSAPRVDAALARGVGHNIDHHHLGRALQLQQLAFALTCTPVPVPA